MDYRITITQSARKEIARLIKAYREKVKRAIEELRTEPRPLGCQKLKGTNRGYRIRVGTYRIVYEIDDENRSVLVFRVRKRDEAYK